MVNIYDFLKYQPDLYKQFTCKDMLFAYYDCPQVRKADDVFTHHNIFVFDISGKKRFYRAGKSWLFEPGNGILMKKGAFIQEIYLGVGYRSINFYVPDSHLRQLIRKFHPINNSKVPPNQPTEPIIELDISEATNHFLQAIIACFSQQPPPSEELLEQRFYGLIFSIIENPANQSVISYLNSIAEQPKTSLYEIMETNYMYNLSLSEYARIANRSLTTFKRDFKELFNTSPAKWLIEKRLGYAQLLLNTTAKSISEISFESGFENNAHFSRTFKEKFGVPPFHYRKEQMSSSFA
ncbi:MAG: AraC family transcriptional regulator [Spirosomataceae bacterium]